MARKPKPTAMDSLKGGLKSMLRGNGTSVRANREAARQEMAKRLAREARAAQTYDKAVGDEYYSKWDPSGGRIDILVDRDGLPTNRYPHVHVVHNDSDGGVRVIASASKGAPVYETALPANADGRQVEAAVREARSKI